MEWDWQATTYVLRLSKMPAASNIIQFVAVAVASVLAPFRCSLSSARIMHYIFEEIHFFLLNQPKTEWEKAAKFEWEGTDLSEAERRRTPPTEEDSLHGAERQ